MDNPSDPQSDFSDSHSDFTPSETEVTEPSAEAEKKARTKVVKARAPRRKKTFEAEADPQSSHPEDEISQSSGRVSSSKESEQDSEDYAPGWSKRGETAEEIQSATQDEERPEHAERDEQGDHDEDEDDDDFDDDNEDGDEQEEEISKAPFGEDVPPPPEHASLTELQKTPFYELVQLASKYGMYVSHERTRDEIVFELGRRFLILGGQVEADGVLEMTAAHHGMLRWPHRNFRSGADDIYMSSGIIRAHNLRPGQKVRVALKPPREVPDHNLVAVEVISIEGVPVADWKEPPDFESLTPCHPKDRLVLESSGSSDLVSARVVDLVAPIGRGQRGIIVAPPRAGKTILLKELAKALRLGNPEVVLLVLLVDERPEEVTDFVRTVDAEVYSSTFDEAAPRHIQVAELLSERAKRLVELGKDVVIMLDSITRLARGYNAMQPGKGRVMSGGVDTKALMKPKRFFSAARNVEEGGSLTILATALVETESRMDDVIFEEFKGTGNMELHLDHELVERRVYPAIHILKSGTRKEELLYHPEEMKKISNLRKELLTKPPFEAMEELISAVRHTRTNAELLLTGLR
ncbi:MAG: transcription termination factor Rho [Verrucomicrobiales bacterium]